MVTTMLDEGLKQLAKVPAEGRIEHMGLGLYGLSFAPEFLESLFDLLTAFLSDLGCAPTHLAIDVRKGKWGTFAREVKHWRAHWREARSFSLVSCSLDEMDHSVSIDSQLAQKASASWMIDRSVVVTFCPSKIGDRTSALLGLARTLAAFTSPRYGMVYRVPFCLGPDAYGIGLMGSCGGQSIFSWGFGVLRFGLYRYLRNVYQQNFLTDLQLNALINGQRLEDWIKQGPRRGMLEPFAGGIIQWTVPEEDISAVRKTLDEAGLFFEYERDINQTCWKYRCTEAEAADYLRTGKEPRYNPLDPSKPSLEIEDVVQGLGVGSGEQEVLRVEEGGKLRKLTPAEVQKIASKGPKSAKKRPNKS